MFSRYLPPDTDFRPVPQEEQAAPPPELRQEAKTPPARPCPVNRSGQPPMGGPAGELLGGVTQEVEKLLGGLFDHFSLESLDTGDILLILIVLFLFLEGDNLDLAIALGLMLLLSFGEEEKSDQPPST